MKEPYEVVEVLTSLGVYVDIVKNKTTSLKEGRMICSQCHRRLRVGIPIGKGKVADSDSEEIRKGCGNVLHHVERKASQRLGSATSNGQSLHLICQVGPVLKVVHKGLWRILARAGLVFTNTSAKCVSELVKDVLLCKLSKEGALVGQGYQCRSRRFEIEKNLKNCLYGKAPQVATNGAMGVLSCELREDRHSENEQSAKDSISSISLCNGSKHANIHML